MKLNPGVAVVAQAEQTNPPPASASAAN